MRIISGSLKGRRLKVPKNNIEPTKDSVKEAIFNIISKDIINKSFLDLYSGSGNIGIEALSRGANSVTMVDNQTNCIKVIRSNLDYLNKKANLIKNDAFHFIKTCHNKFDYIFADPPYDDDVYEPMLKLIIDYGLLYSSSTVILEHRANKKIVDIHNSFSFVDKRQYGITGLLFLSLNEPNIKSKLI